MPARRDPDGKWRFRKVVKLPSGAKVRISGTAPINTKASAEAAERAAIELALRPRAPEAREEVPTFREWFEGRFWREWVIGRGNKPTEMRSKKIIFKHHLEASIGHLRLDAIDVAAIARLRADLVEAKLSQKRINNILAVVSKPLKYAEDAKVIDRAPKVGMFKVERPEIESLTFEEYSSLLAAARADGPEALVAVCLAGEAGMRVGEVKALRWREDVDLVSGTVTVAQQMRLGVVGTPKGRTRRTVPMTAELRDALRTLDVVRTGYVVRNLDGSPWTDGQADAVIKRLCARAGLPWRGWHLLRHTFGTHAALMGVNPWTLMTWMGHKRIDETMLYIHVADAHRRPIPAELLEAAASETDPDRRILLMLGKRGKRVAKGSGVLVDSGVVTAS
jgi:integrase